MDTHVTDKERSAHESRSAERRSTLATSTIRAAGPQPIDVVVLDVSRTGVRIVTTVDLTVGQEISIGLAGAGSTRAFVAWKRDRQYGCRFEEPLDPEGAARAFSQAPVVQLGAAAEPQGDFLRELSASHRPLWLPADAILGFMTYGGAAAGLIYWFMGR